MRTGTAARATRRLKRSMALVGIAVIWFLTAVNVAGARTSGMVQTA